MGVRRVALVRRGLDLLHRQSCEQQRLTAEWVLIAPEDDAVSAVVEKLKKRGLTSPYLKPFVVARVNYTRFSKATSFDYDETLDKIISSAQKFNVERVKQDDVVKVGGAAPDED